MGPVDPDYRTELASYLAVLAQVDDDGLPFILVGGQAANYWANLYLSREPRLQAHLPFTSKDLDVIGTESSARRVALALGWRYSPPIAGGGPVQAVLTSPAESHSLRIEFLSEIKGVPLQTIYQFARLNSLRVEGSDRLTSVRVLDPVLLLHGKLRNAVDLAQDDPDRPRQDVKHVAMLALCIPHFLRDISVQAQEPPRRIETLQNYRAALSALKNSYSGRQFNARHPQAIHWDELLDPCLFVSA